MDTKNLSLLPVCVLMSTLLVISSCKDDDDASSSEPAITSVSPESGAVNTPVTITGHHFSEVPAKNEVKFNGTSAVVTSSTHSQINTVVPAGATSGKITVTIESVTITSPNNFEVILPVEITSIEPSQGVAGTVVIISGSNFSTTASQNVVTFGGNAQAEIIDASATALVVEVPETATSGMMSVTVNGVAATGAINFTILAPAITSIEPIVAAEGRTVVIKGTNFSTFEDYNKVKFNGVDAIVESAASDQLTVTVPQGATTGKVTVQIGPNAATSVQTFSICDDSELAIIAGSATAAGASVNYSITLMNYGKDDIDLAQWGYQNYASVNDVYEPGDAGGGGSQLNSYGILEPGESVVVTSSAGLNPAPYNYYILTISVKPGQPVVECSTTNNQLVVPIQ